MTRVGHDSEFEGKDIVISLDDLKANLVNNVDDVDKHFLVCLHRISPIQIGNC